MTNANQSRSLHRIDRRRFLRGASVALALPWLESVPTLAGNGSLSSSAPVRFACLFMANGVNVQHWHAHGNGTSMQLGDTLRPLDSCKEDIVFLRGLYNHQATLYDGAHLGKIPNVLSGAPISTRQNEIRVGVSMDQVVARKIGAQTDIPSLVLGVEPTELRLEDGLSMIYGSNISWNHATSPATKEIYPARAFDELIDDESGYRRDRSILDQVLEDSHRLYGEVSYSDQRKLDEYLESVRDIEKRIDRASQEQRLEGWKPTLAEPDMPRPDNELPQDVREHMKLMLDIIVLAFRMDKTRVATCMFNNDLSQMNFSFLEGVNGALHLDISHHFSNPTKLEMYQKTNEFHIGQFAYLIRRLKEVQEGERSLLDNSILLFCSSLMDGNKHDATQMPMLLAGSAGGAIKTGRTLDYSNQEDNHRRACSLYLSLMDHMGISLDHFGDADSRLAEI